MQKTLILLFITISSLTTFSQEEKSNLNLKIDVGFCTHQTWLNEINYYNFKYSSYDIQNIVLKGVDVKFTLPGKYKNLDYIFGALFEISDNFSVTNGWTINNTNSFDYIYNGGGVYAGISPTFGNKYVGLDFDFAIGAFSYKEYWHYVVCSG